MSTHQLIYNELKPILKTENCKTQNIREVLEKYIPQIALPQKNLHQQTYSSLYQLHGKPVIFNLMVQDIAQPEYYLAAAIDWKKKNEPINSTLLINKYWNTIQDVQMLEQYSDHIILQRETYHCIPIKGQTSWVKKARNDSNQINSIIVKVYDRPNLKLGQIIKGIGLVDFEKKQINQYDIRNDEIQDFNSFYPIAKVPRINLVRILTQAQLQKSQIDIKTQLRKKQIDLVSERNKLLELFQNFASEKYSKYLLYSLIATQPINMYLSSSENLEELINNLLPYVVKIDLKLPLNRPLFPYKKDILIETQLQLSSENTYVIIDFSNIGEGKIQGEEIQTLGLLKRFVEDGETLYKWQYGESMIKHSTSGLIIRGSSIINPKFHIKQKLNNEGIPKLINYSQNLQNFRAFLIKAKSLVQEITINEDDKQKIEKDFVNERKQNEAKTTPEIFNNRLILSKLQTASRGEKYITYDRYISTKSLDI